MISWEKEKSLLPEILENNKKPYCSSFSKNLLCPMCWGPVKEIKARGEQVNYYQCPSAYCPWGGVVW